VPYLNGCIEHDLDPRPGILEGAVLPEASQDVFHIDNGVIYNDPHSNGKSSQGHGVEAHAEPLQDRYRREQRERNGGRGDGRRAEIEQEEHQDHNNERRSDKQ
jgi:hypothetical protein